MCGRTACTLEPIHIRKACTYVTSTGKTKVPDWKEPGDGSYSPCYNLGPTKYSPVLISNRHFDSECDAEERIILPMSWGLKSIFTGEGSSDSKRIINARHETLLQKPTFRTPLVAGRRCVVLADGYFEWQRHNTEHGKLPYLIHFPQPKDVNFCTPTWKVKLEDDSEWKGPRLLSMAAMFEPIKSTPSELDFAYAVITVEASSAVSHIHDRMPAILDGEEEIRDWLDYGSVTAKQAVNQLKPVTNVEYYRVSPVVNNIRNNTEECITPYVEQKKPNASKNFMENWLQKGRKPTEQPASKKMKTEP